ncbi:phosphomethylpyrimidine synthase ThiC, partial [candidate division WOR-3 bacterium]|nr:phosphomethylpyrimidine synthase ThiC [candidate division WOR-3 bacterium]
MTLIEKARAGKITEEMRSIAEREGRSPEYIRDGIANGRIVIPLNRNRSIEKICAIGEGLKTKVNANIGSSTDLADVNIEIEKARVAEEAGTDTIMDLSTGGDIDGIRKEIIKHTNVPLGTVPIYQAAIEVVDKKGGIVFMTKDDIFSVIEKQAKDGVDFMTVHVGVTLSTFERLRNEGRVMDIVSRGGTFTVVWMLYNKKENPLYEYFDELIEIAREYEITLSLGDGFRPGAIVDSSDRSQFHELILLGELQQRALKAGVQVMIEGPGHIPVQEIQMNIQMEKKLCHGAPFYVLGPVVTDIAPGYDHIVSAIGGAMAAYYGADFLCYVTPSEHLGLPTKDEVKEGVITARIAAHIGDIGKGIPGAYEWDAKMAVARK